MEVGPARPLPGVTLLVRHDEDRRVERRLLRPALLTRFEHALAHHARAGALERLPHDVVVAPLLSASPSFRFSRKNRCGNIHCCSSIHCGPIKSSMDSGAMNPSSDIDTLKNTFPAISPQLPSERSR